jgi:hypothetical protein
MRDKMLTAKYIIPHFDQKRWSEAEPLARRNLTPLNHANAFPVHHLVTTPAIDPTCRIYPELSFYR